MNNAKYVNILHEDGRLLARFEDPGALCAGYRKYQSIHLTDNVLYSFSYDLAEVREDGRIYGCLNELLGDMEGAELFDYNDQTALKLEGDTELFTAAAAAWLAYRKGYLILECLQDFLATKACFFEKLKRAIQDPFLDEGRVFNYCFFEAQASQKNEELFYELTDKINRRVKKVPETGMELYEENRLIEKLASNYRTNCRTISGRFNLHIDETDAFMLADCFYLEPFIFKDYLSCAVHGFSRLLKAKLLIDTAINEYSLIDLKEFEGMLTELRKGRLPDPFCHNKNWKIS